MTVMIRLKPGRQFVAQCGDLPIIQDADTAEVSLAVKKLNLIRTQTVVIQIANIPDAWKNITNRFMLLRKVFVHD